MSRAAVFVVTGSLAFLCGCPPTNPSPEPTPEPDATTVTSGDTRVEVGLDPFAIRVYDGDNVVGETTSSTSTAGCAPLTVGLRPDADEGGVFHAPDAPGEDVLWMNVVRATSNGGGAYTLHVEGDERFVDDDLQLQVTAAEDGFVDLDVTSPHDDRAVALWSSCWRLADDEHVVGGGERFDGVDLKGRTIPLFFQAPAPYASSTNETHAPVPFLATTSGLGVLVESERVGAFDVGDHDANALALRFQGAQLPLRVRGGRILANAAAHARRMGLPPMPPRWALAPQQWRNEHDVTVENDVVVSTGQDRVIDDVRAMRDLGLPNTALWIDAPWSTGHNTFRFNNTQFQDVDAMMDTLHAEGFVPMVWATDNVNSSDDSGQMVGMPEFGSLEMYERFAAEGWLVQNNDGTPFVFAWPRGNGGFVDFTHDGARTGFQEQMRPLLEQGVQGFKLDYAETMRADLFGAVMNEAPAFSDGTTTRVQHTRHARLYHETYQEVLDEVHPSQHFIITRTGGIYDQKNGVAIWPGDLDNDFSRGRVDSDDGLTVGGLPAAVSGALSLSLSGYPLYGSDIGGYRGGRPTRESLLRWTAFGALSTIMQLGGGGTGDTTHNPWEQDDDGAFVYGDDAVDIYRTFARLHMDLLPTLEHHLRHSADDGAPVLVPLGVWLHERDASADDVTAGFADVDAYFMGDLYFAPVVDEGATQRTVLLPQETYVHYFSDEVYTAGTSTLDVPLATAALFLRATGAVLLGDPRLMTAVDVPDAIAADVADLGQYGALRMVRTGVTLDDVDGAFAARDDDDAVQWAKEEVDTGVRISVSSTTTRPLALQLNAVRDWQAADVDVAGVVDTDSEEAFLSCLDDGEVCMWRSGRRLWLGQTGAETAVTVASDLALP